MSRDWVIRRGHEERIFPWGERYKAEQQAKLWLAEGGEVVTQDLRIGYWAWHRGEPMYVSCERPGEMSL